MKIRKHMCFFSILGPFFPILSHLISDDSYISPKNHYIYFLKNVPILHYIPINKFQLLTQLLKLLRQPYICCIYITDVDPFAHTMKFSFISRFSRYPCVILQIFMALSKKFEVSVVFCVTIKAVAFKNKPQRCVDMSS